MAGSRRNPLHIVSTDKIGNELFEVVNQCDNTAWKLKLSSCVVPTDGCANDICYHKACYTKNVYHVLRGEQGEDWSAGIDEDMVHFASKLDFISCLSDALLEGKVIPVADAEEKYREICVSNGVSMNKLIARKP